jgi:hypothetical protein
VRRTRQWLGGTLLVALLGVGGAQRAFAGGQTVDLQVWTIRATTKNNDISSELRGIAEQLKKQFKYTGFKLEKRGGGQAEMDKRFTTSLIGGFEANVTPKRRDSSRVQLQVEVLKVEGKKKTRMLNATVTLTVGKFQLFGGWKLDNTDALIVAVSGR